MTGRFFRKLISESIRMVRDIFSDIRIAADRGDRKFVGYGVGLIEDIIDDDIEMIGQFYGIQEKKRRSLGGSEEKGKHWMEGSPPEILENMYLLLSYYNSLIIGLKKNIEALDEIQARRLDRKNIQYLRELALRVQSGKSVIVEKDPSFWTDEMESDFKEALDYRLDR